MCNKTIAENWSTAKKLRPTDAGVLQDKNVLAGFVTMSSKASLSSTIPNGPVGHHSNKSAHSPGPVRRRDSSGTGLRLVRGDGIEDGRVMVSSLGDYKICCVEGLTSNEFRTRQLRPIP
jgi:hypothetical protein